MNNTEIQQEREFFEQIAIEMDVPKSEIHDICESLDRQALLDRVVRFRRRYWKLKARFDHVHQMAYEPIWNIMIRRAYLFFVYPIKRLVSRGGER